MTENRWTYLILGCWTGSGSGTPSPFFLPRRETRGGSHLTRSRIITVVSRTAKLDSEEPWSSVSIDMSNMLNCSTSSADRGISSSRIALLGCNHAV